MEIRLHANAKTTPKIRKQIQKSTKSVRELAEEFNVNETTIRRWRERDSVIDRSHQRHNLGQSTSLEEEELIEALRINLHLSLNDIVEVMHRCMIS